ncbi:LysE/ArgO family amino acid transporter [Tepidamorphus sp. 3E244]|uniref:LysE/ArgO family amino acid transporter n=1 Tax=Tepidamorphus sp. 3E244 TaxID=3385498 RepID=UPI0038FCD4C4
MSVDDVTAVLVGFALGLTLIIAIGAQNAFVLRQGILREYVTPVVLICAVSDALLIAAGVLGLGELVRQSETLITVATWGGAAFLLVYAGLALKRATMPDALRPRADSKPTLAGAVTAALLFTWANPHVYLDTVVLFGIASVEQGGTARLAFWAGGSLASFVWFAGLGYGARLLAPLFAKPMAWRALDVLIAVTMTAIAISLLRGEPA